VSGLRGCHGDPKHAGRITMPASRSTNPIAKTDNMVEITEVDLGRASII